MTPHTYYIDGDLHISEKAVLTGKQIFERSKYPGTGKVLLQIRQRDEPDLKVDETSKILLSDKPVYFMLVPEAKP